MIETETFIATPDHQLPIDAGTHGSVEPRYSVAVVPLSSVDAHLADWRGLQAMALDDNPFLSPSFLVPASSHLTDNAGISLAMVWEETAGIRSLAGLFPLMPPTRTLAGGWIGGSRASLWHHGLQTFGTPLVVGPETRARKVIQTFLGWVMNRRPRFSSLEISAIPQGSPVRVLLQEEASRLGLPVEKRRDALHTHGLDIRPRKLPPLTAKVTVARKPGDVRLALETLLCFDSKSHDREGRVGLLAFPQKTAFVRAAVRSFSLQNEVLVAMLDDAGVQAGAITILGREKAYLWWIMGGKGSDPMVEATLAAACEQVAGKPLIAASARPLAGVGTEDMLTESISIGLSANASALAARLRLRLGAAQSG